MEELLMKKLNNLMICRRDRTIRLLLAVAALLIVCAQPCSATKAHTHKYQVKSVKCKTGLQTLKCNCGKSKKVRCKKGHVYQAIKDGLYSLKKCKRCGKIVKKYLSKDIPTYWDSSITKALKTAKSRSSLPGYVYLTDPHWTKNAGHSPAIANYIVRQMGYSYAVCGGDVVTGYYDSKQDAVAEIKDFYSRFQFPVLSVEGNHDNNSNGTSNPNAYLSAHDMSRLMYAHKPPGTHMSHGGDFAYIDDRARRVRYITFRYDETRAVADTVLDSIDQAVCELSSDWSVVLFSHAYWHYSRPGGTLSPKPEGKRLADALLDIQRRSDATIVLWHVGHIHRDKYELLSDGQGNRILVVATNCDAYQRSACWGGLAMRKGTATEQVIDIVQVDRAVGRIYMTRIGAGKSRSFTF